MNWYRSSVFPSGGFLCTFTAKRGGALLAAMGGAPRGAGARQPFGMAGPELNPPFSFLWREKRLRPQARVGGQPPRRGGSWAGDKRAVHGPKEKSVLRAWRKTLAWWNLNKKSKSTCLCVYFRCRCCGAWGGPLCPPGSCNRRCYILWPPCQAHIHGPFLNSRHNPHCHIQRHE